ncbi:hypothetical protein B0H10DRAFT_2230579 [Mycena sp. CBHHK59/15]|nr:hypothetical protein B0H10DRAFT_2232613 [Mycena sp. CBHHK59/15]KAJ6601461.1 hypothetical protein B0H10DRAFT_2230579 [Mycena sp. CBHHK59/15]
MPGLLLVAHRVQIWIEPILYKVLLLYETGEARRFPQVHSSAPERLMNSRPASFFRTHVRDVLFVGRPNEAYKILSVCAATVNVLFSRRFSGNLGQFFSQLPAPDFTHALFSHITHLDIAEEGSDPTWAGLALIPTLTHLSFRLSSFPRLNSRAILDNCSSVKVLVIVWPNQAYLNTYAPAFADVKDRRFVMLLVPDYYVDWAIGARGGEDYWVRAEEIVQLRYEAASHKAAED